MGMSEHVERITSEGDEVYPGDRLYYFKTWSFELPERDVFLDTNTEIHPHIEGYNVLLDIKTHTRNPDNWFTPQIHRAQCSSPNTQIFISICLLIPA